MPETVVVPCNATIAGIAALATAATSIFTSYAELSSLTVPDVDDTTWEQISGIAAICHEAVFTAESEEISDLNTFLKEQNQKLYDAGIESLLSGIQSQLDAQKED